MYNYNVTHNGLLVRAQDSGSSGLGSGPARGHCAVSLCSRCLSVPRGIHGRQAAVRSTWQNAGGNLQWTSIPSDGTIFPVPPFYRNQEALKNIHIVKVTAKFSLIRRLLRMRITVEGHSPVNRAAFALMSSRELL